MNKKEKEQLELNNLLQECINEQKAIRLKPADDIEIYINKDPMTNFMCPRDSFGFGNIYKDTKRKIILIRRMCFDKYPKSELKGLIHHELIHLNLKKDGTPISHYRDWELFTKLSELIKEKYNIDPLKTYDVSCFENKKSIPKYNLFSFCPRCGLKNYFNLENDAEYKFDNECSNCGKKLIYEKRTNKN